MLATIGAYGYMEASFFLSAPLAAVAQQRLFQAAQAAQVPNTGWPIGAVLATSTQSRPRPTSEGLAAEIVDKSTKSYDSWVLRSDGSFYFFRNLEEEPEYLLADDRVERMTELLLYCKRLYSFLAVDPTVRVLISVSFEGLKGRALGCRVPDAPETLQRLTGVATGGNVHMEAVVELARIQRDIVKLVKDLTGPLFALFDFYELPAEEYNRLISGHMADWGF
jgi:hypothetical protein